MSRYYVQINECDRCGEKVETDLGSYLRESNVTANFLPGWAFVQNTLLCSKCNDKLNKFLKES